MTTKIEEKETIQIPKRVFIVPYRNRIQHKFFFSKYMSFLLEDNKDYEIYFSHQCDARTFNRGAVKNIGFLAIKNKYPQHYKDITFIFNDIDTIPFYKIFDYQTVHGVVKHYYGFKYALGGIVVMKGADFERINGYPCYWGWGMEDNTLQKRCERYQLIVDRSNFYEIGKPQILQLFDGISRIISKKDPWRSEKDDGVDGLRTISKLNYNIDALSTNPNDNIFSFEDSRVFYVNIKTFLTHLRYENDEYFNYDLREPKRKIIRPDRVLQHTNKVVTNTDDWSNIPYYPTSREKREQTAEYLIKTGKQVPISLLKQIQKDKEDSIKNDVYNINTTIADDIADYTVNNSISNIPINNQQYINQRNYQGQRALMQSQMQQQMYPSSRQPHQMPPPPPPHKYSPQYANYIGAQQRASVTAGTKIRLGGVY
uniref:Galactosyltransferase C-terminal domain-containing protein n=1 Tax=viral metagenome TaxID=1070528 RepID=A0A6C0JH82_9ZZZZ